MLKNNLIYMKNYLIYVKNNLTNYLFYDYDDFYNILL